MRHEHLKDQLASLPDSPGVYRYFNKAEQLIYVGKAKSLKKRVLSYFNKTTQHDRKTKLLIRDIDKLEFTLCETEYDALLLENNLIKQNHPKYNILLRDDKTFPYLCVLKERFPRIITTRRYVAGKGEYFGPYTSAAAMYSVLELVRKMYFVRTCSLLLSEENISKKKHKVCLEYHLGNCKGPCEALQEEAAYMDDIGQARHILKGNLKKVKVLLTDQMKLAAEALKFEKADLYKQRIKLLERYHAKALAVNPRLTHIDVLTITSTPSEAYINYMQVKDGAIIYSTNRTVAKKLNESNEDILTMAVYELRETYQSTNPEVYTNVPVSVTGSDYQNVVPVIGDKKKLVDLSLKNALHLRQKKQALSDKKSTKGKATLTQLQTDLRLTHLPAVVECFDNSNLQGTYPVASMVRFVDGKPDKKGYRHYNIKTVTGPDDFASMKEVVTRRYKRLAQEKKPFPDLVIVDGGKGQLSSACEALKSLGLYGQIPIIGIAKRLEEIYYPEDPIPLHIHKKSQGLKLIQHIRDEAHRFAIEFHRLKRSQDAYTTELESIEGVGRKTADKLLARFKSMKKIKSASQQELAEVVGEKLADRIIVQLKAGSA